MKRHYALFAFALTVGLSALLASCGSSEVLYVAGSKAPCQGVAPMQCLQVRTSPDAPYQLFYNDIAGFTYQPGFDYQLKVKTKKVENTPADRSSIEYQLVKVLSKTPAPLPTPTIGGAWLVTAIEGNPFAQKPTLDIDLAEGRYSGKAFCNRYFGPLTVSESSITFGQGGSTMMACPRDTPDDYILLKALQQVTHFHLSGNTLILLDKDDNKVVECIRAS